MSKPRMRACEYIRVLTRLALVSCLTGCSFTEKQAQLSPLAGAEHRLARAEKIRSDPSERAAEILSVARTAVGEISKESGETNLEPPVRIYNRAAADLASELPELTQNRAPPQAITVQNRQTGEIYQLRPGSKASGEYSAAFFQEFLDAGMLRVRRGEKAVVIPGLGGTLVGVHRSVAPGSAPPRLEFSGGYRVPVTSIVDFGRTGTSAPTKARLRLINPRQRDAVEVGGKRFTLAADFSAPLLSYGRLNELWVGFINMIRGGNMRTAPGLLLQEPYDPDRIPVIFVHGLLASMQIWRRTALALLQDPDIRRHYQFWAFSHPTGNPISFSALKLREDLAFAQERGLV
jgi:hypothetical protein